MILADTSAWVEFIRGTGSSTDHRIADLVIDPEVLAVTEPVIMEVSAGARSDEQERAHRRLLGRCHQLTFDTVSDFAGAAHIYRTCRANGVTPRGLIDCMIAAVALRHGASLLAWDGDLARIAAVVGINVDAASLSP